MSPDGSLRVFSCIHNTHHHHPFTPRQALPEEERSKYVAEAEGLKKPEAGGKKGKAGASDDGGPKLPRSAYQLFCSEERPTLEKGLNVAEQAKELSARWKGLGEAGKAAVGERLEGLRREAAAGAEGEK